MTNEEILKIINENHELVTTMNELAAKEFSREEYEIEFVKRILNEYRKLLIQRLNI